MRKATVDDVIVSFYEASLDASLWKPALSKLTQLFTPAFTSYFFAQDRKDVTFAAVGSDDLDHANASYTSYYWKIDPRATMIDAGAVGDVFACHEHFSDDYVAQSEFYNDFLIPIGGRYILAAKIAESSTRSGILSIHRSGNQGPFLHDDRKLFARVRPHLMQAAKVFDKFAEVQAARDRISCILDHLPSAIIIVDRNAKILETNRAAESLLTIGDALSVRSGRIEAFRSDQASALHRLIREAHLAAGGSANSAGGYLRIDRRGERGCLMVLVAPFRQATRITSNDITAGVILFISDPEKQIGAPTRLLQKLYGLTHAEAVVALAIAAGKTLGEIAEMNAVTRNTVRVQAQSILSKTNSRRQAELVRLILSLPTLIQ